MNVYGVYVRADGAGRIVAVNSDAFISDLSGWIKVDEGDGVRYHHAQGNYLPGPLTDERGVYRYKLSGGAVVERSPAEMDADDAPSAPMTPPGELAFIALCEAGSIGEAAALTHARVFEPWQPGAAYGVGQLRRYEGGLYRCAQAHTSQPDWTPDVTPALWARVADPAEEWPVWRQPTGAHDAYQKGDQVSHGGRRWVSAADGNVWEPGVYGWEEAA